MTRYILRGEYQPGTDLKLGGARAVALLLVHELHETNPGGAVTEEQILAKFSANISALKEAGRNAEAPEWARFLLRSTKKDENWYQPAGFKSSTGNRSRQRRLPMSTEEKALQHLTQEMYAQVAKMMRDAELKSVVTDGLTVLYGPPMVRPDIGIITFQGGGADKSVQTSEPKRLLYLDDPYKFGTLLRRYMRVVELSGTLANRTVAQAVIFPQAPTSQAGTWMTKTGPKARWREFSKCWTERMVEAQRPKVVLVFGEKASTVLGIEWHDIERRHKQNHMTFARADWRKIPTVFCHHLSKGCPEREAIQCMEKVKMLISKL